MEIKNKEDLSSLSIEELLEKEKEAYAPFQNIFQNINMLKFRKMSKENLMKLRDTASEKDEMIPVVDFEILLRSKIELCEQKYKEQHKLLMMFSGTQALLLLVFIVFSYFIMSNIDFPLVSKEFLVTICLLMQSFILSSLSLKWFIHKKFRKEIENIDLKNTNDLFEINKKFMNKNASETFSSVV